MFTKHTTQALHFVLAASVTSAILTATPALAADPIEHLPSTMNQASVYESTLKFYLHPARLELRSEPPRERMDHPAVIIARRAPAGYDWTSAFILHPARLSLSTEAPHPMSDHPAVTVAKAAQVKSASSGEITPHPATVGKASQLPVIHTTQVIAPATGR